MEEPGLEQVRRKVEAGETLTEPELRLLQRAAAAREGPTLKLAVAQALLNADEVHQAMGLLRTLRRDYPLELQVHLALGRAHLLADEVEPADQALSEALRLNPDDPEALKALATIALRRGEVTRARELVRRARALDPLDGESQLLDAELSDPGLGPPPFVPRPRALPRDFARCLVRHLRQLGVAGVERGGYLWLRPSGARLVRVELASWYRVYLDDDGEGANAIERVADELARASVLPPDAEGEALLARVLPVLRPGPFRAVAPGSLERAGPAGLRVYYVLEDPEWVRYLPRSVLKDGALTAEAVDASAWRNLARQPVPPVPVVITAGELRLAEDETGLWAYAQGDGHDGARLLCPAHAPLLREACGDAPLRVHLGSRQWALASRADDLRWAEALEGLPPEEDGIGGSYLLDGEGLTLEGG